MTANGPQRGGFMSRTIGRRDFIKTSAGAGLTSTLGQALRIGQGGIGVREAKV
jgi:hypothetical protein